MICVETTLRVRYADTDKMAFVYYGKYLEYFEVGRTELIRSLGMSYKDIEESGVMLPVSECNIRYHRPARYDDLLTIRTTVPEMPGVKLITEYEIFNQHQEKLVSGKVVLPFVDTQSLKITRIPDNIRVLFERRWIVK
ncbi:MAG: acyl-CoA thioesterase [Bacteroidia bacterium]|nr:acyl-CoA thioesterase [Bacteroidia bacterium]